MEHSRLGTWHELWAFEQVREAAGATTAMWSPLLLTETTRTTAATGVAGLGALSLSQQHT